MDISMRTKRKTLLCSALSIALMMLLGLFASTADAARPAMYKVEETEVGLDPLVGATQLEPGSTSTCSSYEDYYCYWNSHTLTLPFNLKYFDRDTYANSSRIWAYPNGQIMITNTSSTGTPISPSSSNNYYGKPEDLTGTTNVGQYMAALMWDDLIMMGSGATTPKTSWKVLGSAPNRTVVIEYLHMKRKTQAYTTTCGYAGTGDMTAQMHIHEGSNVIEFKYQDAAGGMTWGSNSIATIGLRGSDALKDESVVIQTNATVAPSANYRMTPRLIAEWQGTSSSFTTSSNWKLPTGSNVSPMSTSSSLTSTTNCYYLYVPDTTGMAFSPVHTSSSNYYVTGVYIDVGGSLSITGTGSLNLHKRGTGEFLNDGSFAMSNSSELRITGDLINNGSFEATGGSTTVEFNGTSRFGAQNVQLGVGNFGAMLISDGGDSDNPTTVSFADFDPARFASIENEAGTFLEFQGSVNLSTLGASATINGGLAFASTNAPVTVDIPANFNIGPLKLTSPSIAAPVMITGDIDCASLEMIGDGAFEFSGDVTSSGLVGVNGTGSVTIGTDPINGGNLTLGDATFFLNGIQSLTVNGDITAPAVGIYDINLYTTGAMFVGGNMVAPDGFITLKSDISVNVMGAVNGFRGVTFADTPTLNVGPGPGAQDTLALKCDGGEVSFNNIDDLTIDGDVDMLGRITLQAATSLSVAGDLKAGILGLAGSTPFNIIGDVEMGSFDSQSTADVNIGGDFGLSGDVQDNNPGLFNVGGKIRLLQGAGQYTVEFTNRHLVAGSMVAETNADVSLGGNVDLSFTGLGNIAFEIQNGAKVELADDLKISLNGNGEGVVRSYGELNSFSGAGAQRPTFEGGSEATKRGRFIFAPGSKTNVDGLILKDFGNSFATHAVFFDSGAVVDNLDNLSVTGVASAQAALRIGTGTLPQTINAFEVSGTAPSSVDASNVTGFLVVFTKGPNSGGNLYGAGAELDPQDVVVWDGDTPLAITTGQQLPNAQLQTPFSIQLQTVGGNQPFTWELDQFSPPAWMNIDQATGRLFGTPVGGATGPIPPFSVTVTDSTPNSTPVSKSFRLTVDPMPGDPLQIETNSLTTGFEGIPYSSFVLGVGGSEAGYNYTLSSGTLPSGMSTHADFTNNGQLAGTPDFGSAGDYSLGFVVTDSNGTSSPIKFLTLTIAPGTPRPIFTTVSLPDGNQGVPYSFQLGATNGTAPYEFKIVASDHSDVAQSTQLPTGMAMTTTGLIYGTPTSVGPRSFYILAYDAFGQPSHPQNTPPLLFTLEIRQVDLGPISIDGTNSHGNGGSCAQGQSNNWWIALIVLLPLFALLRRRKEA